MGQSGAASDLAVLYEEHAPSAFRYAFHLTGRREDAEDVVQHVFMQAYRGLESGTTLVSPRAWLMKAVKHRSLNLLRDRREHPMDEVLAEVPAPAAAPEDADELAAVRTMLWTLPEGQHSAFVLRHWSGLSQQEIADVMETTESAVESLLIRARAALVDEATEPESDCRDVRARLVRFLPLGDQHESHVGRCRRCRTARSRLARTAELAAALTLGPRPHVAHALAAAIPGFGSGTATAAGGTAATSASAGAGSGSSAMAGSGTLVSSAPLMAKTGVAAKALAVVLAASAAVGTAHTLRRPLESLVLGGAGPKPAYRSQPSVHTASDMRSAAPDASATAQRAIGAARTATPATASAAEPTRGSTPPGKAAKTTRPTPPGQSRKTTGTASPGQANEPPPGQAKKTGTGAPPGQAKKTGTGTPPGQAKKTGTGTPPGQAKKTGTGTPPGQAKKTGTGTPPGQAKKTGTDTPPSQGVPPGQGAGNGNGHSKGLAKGSSAGDVGSESR
jgi:RNA polymerase sigma factor (sigma-70 family)